MKTDVGLVLYRPEWSALEPTLRSIESSASGLNRVRILCQGTPGSRDLLDLVERRLTGLTVHTHYRSDNLGFTGGHNMLASLAFKEGAEGYLALNPDVTFDESSLSQLLARGVVDGQSLWGPTLSREDRLGELEFDSAGIRWTRSGRHFDSLQGASWRELDDVRKVEGLTGACLLVPKRAFTALVDRTGEFFDDAFFAYREDAELGIRAEHVGVPSFCVWVEGFRHQRGTRGFSRGSRLVARLGVRNRYLLRYKLGKNRPGHAIARWIRDLAVLGAAASIERSSLIGIKEARRIRRFMTYKGNYAERLP